MRLTLVRHAYAGEKRKWVGPDLERPLAPEGIAHAAALAEMLGRRRVARVLSSPAVRCVQTVQGVADGAGVAVELWPDLGPASVERGFLTRCFGDAAFDDAVICTHGELLQPLLRRGDIRREARRRRLDRKQLLIKGCAWRLDVNGDGRVKRFEYLLPVVEDRLA